MNFIHKTKKADRKKGHPADLNNIARRRNDSRVAGGISPAYEKGYGEINWNSKRRKAS